MKHFIAYHNTEKIGRSLQESNPFRVVANKPVDRLAGNLVWFITRDAMSQHRFVLASVFRVSEVGSGCDSDFEYFAAARSGHLFQPPIPLDGEPWFAQFFETVGYFGLAFPQITDPQVIAAFNKFAAEAGCTVPR